MLLSVAVLSGDSRLLQLKWNVQNENSVRTKAAGCQWMWLVFTIASVASV